jgi:type I restriction-modification system DNA methylase subunit
MNQQAKDFIKILEHLKPSRHNYEVFNDWLIMASSSLYSWKKNTPEEEYLAAARNYTQKELEKHSQLLAITMEALENTEQDFLGEVFTKAELTNSRNGQFFTPYNVSHMMAEMAIDEKEIPKNRVCKISDPCCGAGGMLIASAMVMKRRGFNYQHDALFIGHDIDARCARMTFIQLSLLGMPAIIVCGNTITTETYWQRETIMYHMAEMDTRLHMEKIIGVFHSLMEAPINDREQEVRPAAKAIEPPAPKSLNAFVQGELF